MHDKDIYKTSFQTHTGQYEFKVMSFRLINAPSTIQSLMNGIFFPCLRQFILTFFDNILILSKMWEDHLGICKKRVISEKRVSMDLEKIEVVVNYPTPRNIRALKGFLGLVGYYRCFVKDF